MTSSGSAYGRFRRALDTGNLLAARAAATEFQHVGLAEALELTLRIPRQRADEVPGCCSPLARSLLRRLQGLEEATAVLELLVMLEGRPARPAAHSLAGLLDSRTLLPAGEVLVRWANKGPTRSSQSKPLER